MSIPSTVVIPFSERTRDAALALAATLRGGPHAVRLAGPASSGDGEVLQAFDRGDAIRAGVLATRTPTMVVLDPGDALPPERDRRGAAPIVEDRADAVWAERRGAGRPGSLERGVARLGRSALELPLSDPFSGLMAFSTEALRSLGLKARGDEIDAELAVKLASQSFRLLEVPIELGGGPTARPAATLAHARALVRYGALSDPADGEHEGFTTLHRMEGAPRYNRWIARKLRPHLGRRVLEVGAGIGTVTRELSEGRELYLALERDPLYVRKLQNLFRDRPEVEVISTDVAHGGWDRFRDRRLDSVVLSNVLEHIEDDGEAVRSFGRALTPGGRLVILVPALTQLYGALDRAVGHFRRYTAPALRSVLEQNGFAIERLEWMNLVGIPGWFVNGRLLGRRAVPALQLRLYDRLAPLLAEAESHLPLPVGMSLLAVARLEGEVR